jgi:hypothetical protein
MLEFYIFAFSLCLKDEKNSSQEISQSVDITPNKAKVISSNPYSSLVWTCQKKREKNSLQKVAQSARTKPNEAEDTSSNASPPLVWTSSAIQLPN